MILHSSNIRVLFEDLASSKTNSFVLFNAFYMLKDSGDFDN